MGSSSPVARSTSETSTAPPRLWTEPEARIGKNLPHEVLDGPRTVAIKNLETEAERAEAVLDHLQAPEGAVCHQALVCRVEFLAGEVFGGAVAQIEHNPGNELFDPDKLIVRRLCREDRRQAEHQQRKQNDPSHAGASFPKRFVQTHGIRT
jgi:hypothetical protein